MSDGAAARFVIGPDSRPAFTRYARLHEDRARGRTVALAPERAYELDPIGVIVLSAIDGQISVRDLAVAIADEIEQPRHHRQRFTVYQGA